MNVLTALIEDRYGLKEDVELVPLSSKQRNALYAKFGYGLKLHLVYYNSDNELIVIKNRTTYDNWKYYAGLEYVNENDLTYFNDGNGNFFAILEGSVDSRITEIIEILEDNME
jgi:hypothetical protein